VDSAPGREDQVSEFICFVCQRLASQPVQSMHDLRNECCSSSGASDRGHVEADEHDAADLVRVGAGLRGCRGGGAGPVQVEAGLERQPRGHHLQRN
jgi:hypothetical protein